MHMIESQCKFCKSSVRLKVDEEGVAMWRDPDKLIGLAACNQCADYMTQRRLLCERILAVCWEVETSPKAKRGTFRERIQDIVESFARLIGNRLHGPGPSSLGLADKILDQPNRGKWLMLDLEGI